MLIKKHWARLYRDEGGDGNDGGSDSGSGGGLSGSEAGGFGGQGFGDSNTGGFSDGGYSADNAGGYGDAAGAGAAADGGLTGYTSDNGFSAAKDSAAASVAGGLSAADVGGFTGGVSLGVAGAPAAAELGLWGVVTGIAKLAGFGLNVASGNLVGAVAAAPGALSTAQGFMGSMAPDPGFAGGKPGSHSGNNATNGSGFGGFGGFAGSASAGTGGFGGGSGGDGSYAGAAARTAPASFGSAPVQLSSSYGVNVGVAKAGPNSLYGASPTAPTSSLGGLIVAALGAAVLAFS